MRKLLALLSLWAFPSLAQTVINPNQIALVCAYNSSVPAPVSGQYFFVQCDSSGKLLTSTNSGANLTGPITSVGNVTSIASQTGTGTTFAMQTSPSFVTPALGVATGTSLALGGATIGTDALGVTGTATISSDLVVGSPAGFSNHGLAAAAISFGSGVSAATNAGEQLNGFTGGVTRVKILADATASKISINSGGGYGWASGATGGSNDTSFWRLGPQSVSLGSGTAGDFTGGLKLTSLTAVGAAVIFSGLASDAATTDATVCVKSSDGTILKGSGTLGICLGTSSSRYKTDIAELTTGLPEILALPAKSFYLDAAHGNPTKQMYGFTAEDCAKILPKLVGYDSEGRANTCDYLGIVPVLVRAVQEQQAQIETLRGRLN